MGNTLAGAALLACIAAAVLATILMRRTSQHEALMARNPEGSIRKVVSGDQQGLLTSTSGAGVTMVTADATSPNDVRLNGMS